jgi:hypothetical protein
MPHVTNLNRRTDVACGFALFFAVWGTVHSAACSEPGERTAPTTFEVGVAAIDITPTHPIRLNGFGNRREESDGVRQRIWAKALAIGSDAEGPAVLITVDILGIPDRMATRIAERLAAQTAVRRERLALTATHTHSAPMLTGELPTIFGRPIPPEHQAHIDEYTRDFEAKLELVALDALADRKPAVLKWGVGSVGFAKNRRTRGGPVDHDLPLLAVYSPDGTFRAVHFSYACHCVTLSDNKLSGDWAGYAQAAIQRDFPDAIALCSVGCGADSNPSSGVMKDRADIALAQGEQIAAEVRRLLSGDLTPVTGPLTCRFNRVELPLQPLPPRDHWEKLAQLDTSVGHHARVQLGRLDSGESLIESIAAPLQSWTFGDSLAVLFLPGETVVDYSLRLKRELDAHRLWVVGYANAAPGYVPSERILREGGYEGGGAMIYYDIPMPYAPGLEDKIINELRGQVGERFNARVDVSPTAEGGDTETTNAERVKAAATDTETAAAQPIDAGRIAVQLLDESLSREEREQLIQTHLEAAPSLIAALTKDLPEGEEEYRRIPWIWRVSIAAGRRNDAAAIRSILELSLPGEGRPLRHWQAVVIGGGIINGISQQNLPPRQRIAELISSDTQLTARWNRLLEQSAVMADNEAVPSGTRYDALRILGCGDWTPHGEHLQKYLAEGTHAELQMGAVSGLSDLRTPQSTNALIAARRYLQGRNRELALDALLVDQPRIAALLDAVARGDLTADQLGPDRIHKLRQHPDAKLRERAAQLLQE